MSEHRKFIGKDLLLTVFGVAFLIFALVDGYRDWLLHLTSRTTTADVLEMRNVPGGRWGSLWQVRYSFQDDSGQTYIAEDRFRWSAGEGINHHTRTIDVRYWPPNPGVSRVAAAVRIVEPLITLLLGLGVLGWAIATGCVSRLWALVWSRRHQRTHP